jgi:hypothetical protein
VVGLVPLVLLVQAARFVPCWPYDVRFPLGNSPNPQTM